MVDTNQPMNIQHQKIEQAFMNWKGGNEQVDDVLVVGIKIPEKG